LLVDPTLDAYRYFAEAAKGKLRIMTIAPELTHAPEIMKEMISSGVQPSMGHTDATFEEADRAVKLGVRQATHMFNAMRPFGHRDPGIIAKVLTDPSVKAELIADGVHVDPKAIELLYRSKGAEGIILISDGISAVGMPDGEYEVIGLHVQVKDGACTYDGHLAGSIVTLDRAVRNMIQFVGASPAEAIRMATLNTAELMGVSDRKGQLKEGADADLVILDADLNVKQVYTRGLLLQ
jgi:N-acetylglucosamine-6-phosphate deacetylase